MVDDTSKIEEPKDEASVDRDGKPTMHIRVASPFKTFLNEEAYSITAENDTGTFDILPRHHNFITLLNECELLVQTGRGELRIQISGGVMHVKADRIVIFLNV